MKDAKTKASKGSYIGWAISRVRRGQQLDSTWSYRKKELVRPFSVGHTLKTLPVFHRALRLIFFRSIFPDLTVTLDSLFGELQTMKEANTDIFDVGKLFEVDFKHKVIKVEYSSTSIELCSTIFIDFLF